jgi:hypothetical protein
MIARLTPWALAALLALCCALLIHRALRVESDAARVAEASQLVAQGQIVAAQRDRYGIKADLDAAIDENAQLKEALDEARKAAPGAKVERVLRASTGPVPMSEAAVRSLCSGLITPPAQVSVDEPALPIAPLEGEIHVASVELRSDKGNLLAAGGAEAWQVSPGPRQILFSGRFVAPASYLSEVAPTPDDRWPWYVHEAIGLGAGLAAGIYLGSR